jgi:hypothetical protein
MRILLFAFLTLALAGCSSGRQTQQNNLSTPVGQSLTASVGEVVFRAEGRETVKYGGLQGNEVLLLVGGPPTTSQETPPPRGSAVVTAQPPATSVLVDWRANPQVSVLGKIITIQAATPSALWYKLGS